MIDSLFYYPMTLHRGNVSASVLAPFVKNLPPVSGVVEEIYVRTQDANPAGSPGASIYGSVSVTGVQGGQGVYVWDAVDKRFRFVMPYTELCAAVVVGSYVDIYYDIDISGPTIPAGATVYRNGALYAGTSFTVGDRAVWSVLLTPSAVAGNIKTVQGVSPDANGNVNIPNATQIVAGLIRVGANLSIDSNGVLSAQSSLPYVLPAATTTTLGGVIAGNGLAIAPNGLLNANVTSVSGREGDVVLSASDITTGTFIASVIGETPGNNEVLITNAAGVPTWVSTLPSSNLPSSILGAVEYQGTFVPGTSTLPAAAAGNKGWYYVASAAGTYTPPGGTLLTFSAGDWLISNGTEWDTVANHGAVTSVNGQTGAVVVQAVDNNNATGTSLISDSGSSTGVFKLKTLVAGSAVTITPDVNGNLVIASSGGVSSFNSRMGAVTLTLADVTGVGGAPLASPVLTGTPMAPTAVAGTDTTQIATTAFVMSAVNSGVAGVSSFNTRSGAVTLQLSDVTNVGGAPIASPAFTGNPTAPTPPTSDDSTNIATTAFVAAAIEAGVAGAVSLFEFIATQGQTVFDATFPSGAFIEVFLNGGLLLTSDYGTNNGVGPVTLNTGATLDDEVKIIGTSPFNIANVVPITGGTYTGVVSGITQSPGDNSTAFATTAFVDAALAAGSVLSFNGRTGAVTLTLADVTGVGGAPLASPALTGTPTAPTATAGTNTTQLATTAFVTAAVASSGGVVSFNTRTGAVTLTLADVTGVGGAPLASPTFTGTVAAPTPTAGDNSTKVATTAFVATSFAPLASPALSGTPTAPTATAGTNTTQLATTAFVTAAVAAGTAGVTSFNSRTGAVTLTLADVTGVGGAPLASPALTGTPTAPTATVGTNTTQLATSALVYAATQGSASVALSSTAAVSLTAAQYSVPVVVFTGTLTTNVVVTVPTTGEWSFLNLTTGAFTVTISNGTGATVVVAQSTTNYVPLVSNATEGIVQLSAGSAGVSSFNTRTGAVTLIAADVTGVGGALLASPTFTGTPAAPTATAGNNGTTLATTAFVYNATQATGTVALTNANVTLSATQYGNAIIDFTGTLTGNVVITFPTTGQWTLFNNTTGAFTVTVTNGGGATFAIPQGATIEVVSSGATTGMLAASTASPVRFQSPAYSYSVTALGSVSGTQTLNIGTASEFTMTISGATTIAFTNTLLTGTSEVVYIRFTNAGSAAITWPASTKFAGGAAPTFTTSGVDIVGVKYDTTTSTYMVFVVGLAVA